jgi:hypothetical protein
MFLFLRLKSFLLKYLVLFPLSPTIALTIGNTLRMVWRASFFFLISFVFSDLNARRIARINRQLKRLESQNCRKNQKTTGVIPARDYVLFLNNITLAGAAGARSAGAQLGRNNL